jgi:hypothetical protein
MPRSRAIRRASVGARRLLDLGHLLGAVRRRALATFTLLVARGRAGALLLRLLLHLGRRLRSRDLLALLADHGNRLADGDLPFGDGDLQQHARRVGLDLLRDFVRIELVERLALLDLLALRLQPADDRARLHALAEARELDLSRHGPQSS